MHYYKRHLGDYAKKAGHLTPLEHGVYCLILDAYYDREQAPTRVEAVRLARARTPEEVAAVENVLDEFFVEDAYGRFRQKRADEEIAEYHALAEVNRRTAIEREAAKRARKEQDRGTTVPAACSSREPNQEPRTINQEEQEPLGQPRSRFPEFWDEYPNKVKRKPAEAKWRAKRLDLVADVILNALRMQKAMDARWLDGYVPDPTTYINQERWRDEIRPARARAGPTTRDKAVEACGDLEDMRRELGLAARGNPDGVGEAPTLALTQRTGSG